jgi:hypothetical protein
MIHVSQVFYVDPTHVALSFQSFSKGARHCFVSTSTSTSS